MKPQNQNEEVIVKKKVGVYCRVSTREQVMYGYGIDVQKNKIQGYIDLFDIYPVTVDYFVDEGCSAKDMQRKEMIRLLEAVKAKDINVIIIYKLDRLSRNVLDVYNFIETLQVYGCNLISVMDNIDIYTANGRMLVGLLAIIAQWERETVIERTMDGLNGAAKQGKFPIPTVPFGYVRIDKKLYVDPDTSKIVIRIFELAGAGVTIKEIERYLLEEYPQCHKDAQAIKKVLVKPLYYGYFEYHGVTYPNTVPAIISKKLFNKAQHMISKRFITRDNRKYYYGNKVNCICGEILDRVSTKKKSKKYYYYYCPCCNKRINQDKLLFQTLPELFSNFNKLDVEAKSKKISRKIKNLNTKMNKQYELYVTGKINTKMYAVIMQKLITEKDLLEAEAGSYKLCTSQSEWMVFTDTQKKQFIQNLIDYVVVDLDLQTIVSLKMGENK